ncbi:MAG: zinc ribbon domain-containing protein [Candidatus Omnitrophota bacterium]
MPTYQYECQACNHEFETLQTMMEAKLTKCPKCGKKKLVRLIGSGSGMIFKGSGFYETDYKRKPSDVKTDCKPSAPAEAKSKPVTPCGGHCGCHPH